MKHKHEVVKTEVTETVAKEKTEEDKKIEFIQNLNKAKIEAARKIVEILNDREFIGVVTYEDMRSLQKEVIRAVETLL